MDKQEFTPKEIEVFMFMHEFRKQAQAGEITVTYHNLDFDKLKNIKYEAKLTGQTGTAGIEFTNKLLKVISMMREEPVL